MRRVVATLGLLAALTLAAGCGSSSKKSSNRSTSTSAKVAPANLTIWTPFVNPELITFKKVIADFVKANPGMKVKVVGGINDDKSLRRSAAATRPTSLSPSPPTTPAPSALAAPGSISARS